MQRQTGRETAKWVEVLSRLGIAAKGIVYALVGILALQAAFGAGGQATDQQGAFGTVISQPFGKFLLSLIALGLIGYVVWRLVQTFKDPDRNGTDAEGLLKRFAYFISAVIYGALAFAAIQIVLGNSSGSSGDSSAQDWTARLMSQPFGQWLVGTVGAIIIAIAFYHFYQMFSAKFRKYFKWHEMSQTERTWSTRLGRLGHGARGVTFLIIGGFFIQAAIRANPNEARGLGGALRTLEQQPYGPWLLGLVALGFIAYGIYLEARARYRRIAM
ncbi:MAG: DUF1206 domain-containing protein [Thainema sp.]